MENDFTSVLMDNVDRAFEQGRITEKERDQHYDDIMRQANEESDKRRQRYG